MARYRLITEVDINKKNKSLQYVFFKAIDDRVRYTSESNTPFSSEQVLQMSYHAVNSSTIYIDTYKDWRSNPSTYKMWDKFKIFFVLDYDKLQEKHHLNAAHAGFHNANHVSEEQQYFASALDNLYLADFSDNDVIAQIISSKIIDRVQQKYNIHHYKPDPECNRKQGAGN